MNEHAQNLERESKALINEGQLDAALQRSAPFLDDPDADMAVAAMLVQREVAIMRLQNEETDLWQQHILTKVHAGAHPRYLVRALYYVSRSPSLKADRKRGTALLDEATKLATSMPDDTEMNAYVRNFQSAFLLDTPGKPVVALSALQEDLEVARKAGVFDAQMDALGNLFSYFAKLGDAETAKSYSLMLVDESRQANEWISTSVYLAGLGKDFRRHNDLASFQEAAEYGREAVAIADRLNVPLTTYVSHFVLGTTYGWMSNWQAAAEHMTKALAVLERIPHDARIAYLLKELSAVALQLGNYRGVVNYGERYFLVPEAFRTEQEDYCVHVFLLRAFSYLRKHQKVAFHQRAIKAGQAKGYTCL